jgi:hypothetical protein
MRPPNLWNRGAIFLIRIVLGNRVLSFVKIYEFKRTYSLMSIVSSRVAILGMRCQYLRFEGSSIFGESAGSVPGKKSR